MLNFSDKHSWKAHIRLFLLSILSFYRVKISIEEIFSFYWDYKRTRYWAWLTITDVLPIKRSQNYRNNHWQTFFILPLHTLLHLRTFSWLNCSQRNILTNKHRQKISKTPSQVVEEWFDFYIYYIIYIYIYIYIYRYIYIHI